MGFTFDPPSSDATPPYKPNPQKSRVPKLSSKAPTASVTSSNSFLDHLFHRVRNPFHHSSNSARAKSKSAINPAPSQLSNRAPSADPLFFRLPLELREAIYRLVVAHNETLHILMKRRPNGLSHPLVHRRCQAGGDLNGCILHDCKRFLAAEGGQGCYFGSFATVSGLLYTCRDMYVSIIFSSLSISISGSPVENTAPAVDVVQISGSQRSSLHPKHIRVRPPDDTQALQEDTPPILVEQHQIYINQLTKGPLLPPDAHASVHTSSRLAGHVDYNLRNGGPGRNQS